MDSCQWDVRGRGFSRSKPRCLRHSGLCGQDALGRLADPRRTCADGGKWEEEQRGVSQRVRWDVPSKAFQLIGMMECSGLSAYSCLHNSNCEWMQGSQPRHDSRYGFGPVLCKTKSGYHAPTPVPPCRPKVEYEFRTSSWCVWVGESGGGHKLQPPRRLRMQRLVQVVLQREQQLRVRDRLIDCLRGYISDPCW